MSKNLPAVQYEKSLLLDSPMFEHAQKVAKMLSESTMVPEHFRGPNNIGNCVIALNYANRLNIDPFMLMQKLYVVHGKPGIESQLAIALINQSGKFTQLNYTFIGKAGTDSHGCIAWAKHTATNQKCESVPVTIGLAKREGWYQKKMSKWPSMPELMLQYRSAAFFARAHCPETLLGLHTKEELLDASSDIVDVTPTPKTTALLNEPSSNEIQIHKFNVAIQARKIDKNQIDEFISLVAAQNHILPDDVKVEAINTEKSFDEFIDQFKKHYPDPTDEKKPIKKPALKKESPKKKKESDNMDWPEWSKKWSRLSANNFKGYLKSFLKTFREAPAELQLLAIKKWNNDFPDEICPLNSVDIVDDNGSENDFVQTSIDKTGLGIGDDKKAEKADSGANDDLYQTNEYQELSALREEYSDIYKKLFTDKEPATLNDIVYAIDSMTKMIEEDLAPPSATGEKS